MSTPVHILLKKGLQPLLLLVLLVGLLSPPGRGFAEVNAQALAEELLQEMTAQERVGQLVLVTFTGTDVEPESAIYDLITNHHVGGVVLEASNDNIIGPEGTASELLKLTNSLQQQEWEFSQSSVMDPVSGDFYLPNYIPLIVAISQEGDGYPHSNILNGMTPLPNSMALGATWNPNLATQSGEVLGRELSALGINMLLGPSLDVLEDPNPDVPGDLGTRTYGGDPFWVGEFGKAFVSGLHRGSEGRIAVIGKYFPGRGSSDRLPEEEVATIRKTMEQLKVIELAPFFAVTGDAPSTEQAVDGLLTSHIKYQGLQSNIRATTRPISFDPQAFNQLMSLPALAIWRQEGGLMVSDELGSRAVRRFYDPSGETFNARFVARDAFLAGNDLLYLGDFTSSEFPDQYATIVATLDFFTQKYREDAAFAQRVDEAALRILKLKFRLFEDFEIDLVLTGEEGLEELGKSQQVTFEVARQGATLISPSEQELDTLLPNSPTLSERIVFITDSFDIQQCSDCPLQPILPVESMQEAVLRLYGPESGAQIQRRNLLSYSFAHIISMLDRGPGKTEVEYHIRNAQWIVFSILDVRSQRPTSLALRRFLAERPDLLRGKQVVVFAFNAPYFLDATDISKLTAYYGLYSKQPQFLEVAARLLFKELSAPGASPVSVSGTNYVLSEALSPDLDQTIKITLYLSSLGPPAEDVETPEPPVEYRTGDTVVIQTGRILDNNGHQIPDNSLVRFSITTTTTEGTTNQREITVLTISGEARTSIILDTAGITQIQASIGDPSPESEIIQIDVAVGEEVTGLPTDTVSPGDEEGTPPADGGESNGNDPPPRDYTSLGDWLVTLFVTVFIGLFAYQAGALAGQVRWGVRWGLAALIGGLAVNTYLSFNLPGVAALITRYQIWGIVICTMIGAFLGWGAGVLWRRFSK